MDADPLSGRDEEADRPQSLIEDAPAADPAPAAPTPPPPPPAPTAAPPASPPKAPPADPAPPPPPDAVVDLTPPSSARISQVLGSDPLVDKIGAARSFEELALALEPCQAWEYAPEHAAGVARAKTYVAGSDKDVLAGFFVMSLNEWKLQQPRALVLSKTAYYRVTYSHKTGRIDHYHKTPFSKFRVVEKKDSGLKIFLTEQDGKSGAAALGKTVLGWMGKAKPKDEFEHARDYTPCVPVSGPASLTASLSAPWSTTSRPRCMPFRHSIAVQPSHTQPSDRRKPVEGSIGQERRRSALSRARSSWRCCE